ncbi:hypothetical protein OUZ56_032755 [Daphnia magna]|uniref:Uncharacterized protein n=1 Tax=Daphnia magna TaxID=35525 RepID=A0ABQ9ZX15_9CRUS|nr:hypothetical protein OUZ56_032755 [Daphnia magna]
MEPSLESGYWQIPMKKEDTEKTAFTTTDGSYRLLVMPFGLSTAQSPFQWTMDTIPPLNYGIQLNNSKTTKVVYVERLKSFIDLTQPAPNTDGEAQSTDRVKSEGTTDELSKDGYTPVDPQQKPKGPAHPRKQLKEKKVRFTTSPEEP